VDVGRSEERDSDQPYNQDPREDPIWPAPRPGAYTLLNRRDFSVVARRCSLWSTRLPVARPP
jgi:hypothetical protein